MNPTYLVQSKSKRLGNRHDTDSTRRDSSRKTAHLLPQRPQANQLILQRQLEKYGVVIRLLNFEDVAARAQEDDGDHQGVVRDGEADPFPEELRFVVAWMVEEVAVADCEGDDDLDVFVPSEDWWCVSTWACVCLEGNGGRGKRGLLLLQELDASCCVGGDNGTGRYIQWSKRKHSTWESGLAMDENGSPVKFSRSWSRGLEATRSGAAVETLLARGMMEISFRHFSARSRLLWACAWRKACE